MSHAYSCCGQLHDTLPDLAFDSTTYVQAIPEAERDDRVRLDGNRCIVDDAHFFIRGVIEIFLYDASYTWGLGV